MGKRANGEGSIYKDQKRGVWVAAITINGKRIKRTAPTQKEAKALRDDLLKDASRLASRDKDLRTVNDLLSAWFESQTASGKKAPSTLDTTRWAIEHIRQHLGPVKLSKLSFHEVETMLKALTGKNHNLSRLSLDKIRSVLNQACKWGMRRKALVENPVAIAEIPKTKATKPKRSLTLEQFYIFRETLAGSRLEVLWLIYIGLGLRSGEGRALLWKDWDRTKGTLAVMRNITKINGVNTLTDDMKTATSKRNLTLPHSISLLLEDLFERSQIEGRANGDDLIFSTSTGRPLDAANLRRDLRKICAEAGIPRFTVHELRHTCGSLLADAGVPAEHIADVLGHRDIRTTLGTYRHVISPSISGHVDAMNSILNLNQE